jgi:protease YdgD
LNELLKPASSLFLNRTSNRLRDHPGHQAPPKKQKGAQGESEMVGALSRGLLVFVALVAAAPSGHGSPIGLIDLHREDVDQSRYPWAAIGKVTNETGGSCSGVVIASSTVLTAAHCLYNYRGRRFVGAEAVHFLLGYRAGRYAAHARVARYEIGQGFDPQRYDETFNADWAVLTLAEALPKDIVPLKLSADVAPSGTKAMLAGYPQDRAQALTADRNCELRERIDQGRLMLHTCRSAHGVSGAPILVANDAGEVRIAGVQIATRRSNDVMNMIAIPAQAVAQRPGKTTVATAVLPGDPDGSICFGGGEQMAALGTIRDRIGLQPPQALSDELAVLGHDRHEPLAPTSIAWVMQDRFLFAVE